MKKQPMTADEANRILDSLIKYQAEKDGSSYPEAVNTLTREKPDLFRATDGIRRREELNKRYADISQQAGMKGDEQRLAYLAATFEYLNYPQLAKDKAFLKAYLDLITERLGSVSMGDAFQMLKPKFPKLLDFVEVGNE